MNSMNALGGVMAQMLVAEMVYGIRCLGKRLTSEQLQCLKEMDYPQLIQEASLMAAAINLRQTVETEEYTRSLLEANRVRRETGEGWVS